jgi:thiamine-phosphate pyrophosphorylase
LMAGADGVHLGQDDLPAEAARKLLGNSALIGLSTHDLDQVKKALTQPIDYIAFGPVFSTSTKTDTEPVAGLELLAEARRLVSGLPLVAIGGINADNLHSVLGCGADSAAMISSVLLPSPEIAENVRGLLERAEDLSSRDHFV